MINSNNGNKAEEIFKKLSKVMINKKSKTSIMHFQQGLFKQAHGLISTVRHKP